jgi:hypothetical protein
LGGAPTVTGQEQKILDFVSSWACTSSPMTGKTRVFSTVSEENTEKILARGSPVILSEAKDLSLVE